MRVKDEEVSSDEDRRTPDLGPDEDENESNDEDEDDGEGSEREQESSRPLTPLVVIPRRHADLLKHR